MVGPFQSLARRGRFCVLPAQRRRAPGDLHFVGRLSQAGGKARRVGEVEGFGEVTGP